MRTRRRIASALLVPALMSAVLVACARGTTPPTAAPSPSGPAVTAAPTTPAPSQPATPTATAVLTRVAYQWHWPNDAGRRAVVSHAYPVPPLPQLIRLAAAQHPADPGERPFDRMSFTFTTAFPSYEFSFVDRLVGDGSGQPIPLEGTGVLRVVFREARAHGDDGTASVVAAPPAHLGYPRMVGYAPAGDFEGVVTYGIGITWPLPTSNPQIAVRAYEVEQVSATGQHLYMVAIDVDATLT